MIKVMLVDDQNLVRKGVRSLLELSEEIEVVAEAPDGAEAVAQIPEVLLLLLQPPVLPKKNLRTSFILFSPSNAFIYGTVI